MTRKTPAPARPPERLQLAQQQADFTAEGSPPPGRVATAAPDGAPAKPGPAARRQRAPRALPPP
jgi:hypothetical protein